jgi:hypothetical protein
MAEPVPVATLLKNPEVPSMPESSIANPEAVKAEWLDRLERLVADVKGWAEADGWRTRVYRKPMNEDPALGRYEAPRLVMERERDGVVVALNPVARFVPGADGGVDLYLMPGYDDIASLYYEGGRWHVHYARRSDLAGTQLADQIESLPYSEETIRRILDSMAALHA